MPVNFWVGKSNNFFAFENHFVRINKKKDTLGLFSISKKE